MGVPVEWAMGTVRFSVGRDTTAEEIARAVEVVAGAAKRLGAQGAVASLKLMAGARDSSDF
jgi:cysteine sulfinate desulfinase/cysteine desulfurase-like protein